MHFQMFGLYTPMVLTCYFCHFFMIFLINTYHWRQLKLIIGTKSKVLLTFYPDKMTGVKTIFFLGFANSDIFDPIGTPCTLFNIIIQVLLWMLKCKKPCGFLIFKQVIQPDETVLLFVLSHILKLLEFIIWWKYF